MKDLGAGKQQPNETYWLLNKLNLHLEQEWRFQPREKGLSLIESTSENESTICPRLRNAKVEDLWTLTHFFGFETETFVLAINILDRFLALMKVKPKHLSCIGVCCFQLAARVVEQECNIPSISDIIRISQCKCTASDMKRMEKIISEKLHFEFKATTALTFLHLYHTIVRCHTSKRNEMLNIEKLEAQLKACNCRLVFSKAKPSVLALCLLSLEVETLKSNELFDIALHVQKHSKVEGTAMGSAMAPNLANLYVEQFEITHVCSDTNPHKNQIHVWKRSMTWTCFTGGSWSRSAWQIIPLLNVVNLITKN